MAGEIVRSVDAGVARKRDIPESFRANAEKMIELLHAGRRFRDAQNESGLMPGQVEMVMRNDPELWNRIEVACDTFRKMAKHELTQEAMRVCMEGDVKEVLDKNGNVVEVKAGKPQALMIKMLEGLDRDNFGRKSDAETRADAITPVVMNLHLPEGAMLTIKSGNSDIVAGAADAARLRQEAARKVDVIDITPKE